MSRRPRPQKWWERPQRPSDPDNWVLWAIGLAPLLAIILFAALAMWEDAHAQSDDPYMDGLRDRLMSITMDQCGQEVKLLGLYGVETTDASWYECVAHYTAETGRRLLAGSGFVETPWRGVAEMRKREAQ